MLCKLKDHRKPEAADIRLKKSRSLLDFVVTANLKFPIILTTAPGQQKAIMHEHHESTASFNFFVYVMEKLAE